ncbi:MAG: transposase [Bacteroidota bacterium]|nr:transposase [Bacteroidota bacterium]
MGYLQTDGYTVYEQFARNPQVTHLACMAFVFYHAICDFFIYDEIFSMPYF